jgi:ubiquinone/menaquinone biosynthesis C-methylase UbiE
MDTKAEWYNDFYTRKKILTTYAWYEGLGRIFSIKKINFTDVKVLEIGSGAGEFLNTLPCRDSFGLDISEAALRIARSNSTHARFLKSKAETLPFKDERFDIVICCEVIEHVDDPLQTLHEIHRVLKKDGALFISFPNYYNPIYLFVRLMATFFKQPQWISLQIVDRYLFFFKMVALLKKTGFSLHYVKGTCYSHQKIPGFNLLNWGEGLFDRLGLQFLSFHPVLYLIKINQIP